MSMRLLVAIKGFGDFVIAAHGLRALGTPPGPHPPLQVLAGDHMRQLAAALGIQAGVAFLPIGGGAYPAAFDVRGGGLSRALANLARLRGPFSRLPPGSELIFDRFGWRERYLGSGFRCRALVRADNVYHAVTGTLQQLGYDLAPASPPLRAPTTSGRVAIFTTSRVLPKTIPPNVIDQVIRATRQVGLHPEVIALQGEKLELPQEAPVKTLEKSFGAVAQVIRDSALVISSDSVPAHLAEYLGTPSYVLSPVPNQYWLPLSCFSGRAWSLFSDEAALPRWLQDAVIPCAAHG